MRPGIHIFHTLKPSPPLHWTDSPPGSIIHPQTMAGKFLLILFISAAPILARDIKVSSTADIAAALADVKPGDSLIMVDGAWIDQPIVFKAAGAEGKPVTLRPQTPAAGQERWRAHPRRLQLSVHVQL